MTSESNPENMAKAGALHNDLDARRAATIQALHGDAVRSARWIRSTRPRRSDAGVLRCLPPNAFRGQTLRLLGGINGGSSRTSSGRRRQRERPTAGTGGNTVVNTASAPLGIRRRPPP